MFKFLKKEYKNKNLNIQILIQKHKLKEIMVNWLNYLIFTYHIQYTLNYKIINNKNEINEYLFSNRLIIPDKNKILKISSKL